MMTEDTFGGVFMENYFRVLKKFRTSLLKLPNVTGVGIGLKQVAGEITNRPALIIFVEKRCLPAFYPGHSRYRYRWTGFLPM